MKNRSTIFNSIPNKALFEDDLIKFGKILIPNFIGVFNRENLPQLSKKNKAAYIVNLDDIKGKGTHWVAVRKNKNCLLYFDSFGNLPPPNEFIAQYSTYDIYYNTTKFQSFNLSNCGKLCVEFLMKSA